MKHAEAIIVTRHINIKKQYQRYIVLFFLTSSNNVIVTRSRPDSVLAIDLSSKRNLFEVKFLNVKFDVKS